MKPDLLFRIEFSFKTSKKRNCKKYSFINDKSTLYLEPAPDFCRLCAAAPTLANRSPPRLQRLCRTCATSISFLITIIRFGEYHGHEVTSSAGNHRIKIKLLTGEVSASKASEQATVITRASKISQSTSMMLILANSTAAAATAEPDETVTPLCPETSQKPSLVESAA